MRTAPRALFGLLVLAACGTSPTPAPQSTALPRPTPPTTTTIDAGLDAMAIDGFATYLDARSDELCPQPSPDTEEEEGTCGLIVDALAQSSAGQHAVVYTSESIYAVTVYLALAWNGAWTSVALDAPIDAMVARERRATVSLDDRLPGTDADIVVTLDWDEGTEPDQPLHRAMVFVCRVRRPDGALGCAATAPAR